MGALTFITWAPGFNPAYGGVIALHKLAHYLAKLGEDSYLYTDRINPLWQAAMLPWDQPFTLDLDRTVVIYPEIVVGNPLNAKHVVRWVLNTPGVCGGDGEFGEQDLIFKFQEYFSLDGKYTVSGLLTAIDVDFDTFRNRNEPREGECFMVYKGKEKPLNQHKPDSLCIDAYRGHFGLLADVFNSREMFICYDHATFVFVQAALCGCLAVVIPDGVHDREEWTALFPGARYGIAYGFDDIPRARETLPRVRETLEQAMDEDVKTVVNFIQICKSKFSQESLPKNPDPGGSVRELVTQAFRLFESGDLDAAYAICNRLLTAGVQEFYVFYLAGIILFQRNQYGLAADPLNAALRLSSNLPEDRVKDVTDRLVAIHKMLGKGEPAI